MLDTCRRGGPVKRAMRLTLKTLRMKCATSPATTPFAMEYVIGITVIVRKAGREKRRSSQSIAPAGPIIKAPTMMQHGAVAVSGTAAKIGRNGKLRRKRRATTRPVRPVLPPSAIPAHLQVVGEAAP